jgi:hypothetical protein
VGKFKKRDKGQGRREEREGSGEATRDIKCKQAIFRFSNEKAPSSLGAYIL